MSIVLTGTKTVTTSVAPHLTAAALTTLLAKAIEQITWKELQILNTAVSRVTLTDENKTIGQLLV